jgi:hypothetical protein
MSMKDRKAQSLHSARAIPKGTTVLIENPVVCIPTQAAI